MTRRDRDISDLPHALLVDESLMVRRVGARIIRDLGYQVSEAETGSEALDMARLSMPDVILCDWRVGDMDAGAVMEALRAEPGGEDVVVILCTADRRVERITQALAAGASEYIMKPFDSDIIESKLALAGLPVRAATPQADYADA